jgi:hypothetical protein
VFSGSFTLAAAEAVCDSHRTVDVLASLVAKSMVNLVDDPDETRYRLLETVRLYAQDRLVEAGEAAQRRDRHRDFYLGELESIGYDALVDLRLVSRCLRDYGNQQAALDWSLAQGRHDLVARLVDMIGVTWTHVPAMFEESRQWLLRIADDPDQPDPARASALCALAVLVINTGDIPAVRAYAARALAIEDQGDSRSAALWAMGRYAEATVVAQDAGLPAMARWSRAWAASERLGANPAAALALFDEILAETDPNSAGWDRWWALMGASLAHLLLDDGEQALVKARNVGALLQEFEAWGGSLYRYAGVLESMALSQLRRFDEARAALHDVAAATLRDHFPLMGVDWAIALAYLAIKQGDPSAASALLNLVVRDGRMRCQPMYFFFGRMLFDLHGATTATELEPPLPTVTAFVNRATRLLEGTEPPDPAATAAIDAALEEFVASRA